MKEPEIDKSAVIAFVRRTLGCTCPDAVFEHIDLEEHIALLPEVTLARRYNIGNRLLIYLLDAEEYALDFLVERLETIVNAGKAERDRREFNRFRLVLLSHETATLEQHINARLAEMSGLDERVHVHVIKPL